MLEARCGEGRPGGVRRSSSDELSAESIASCLAMDVALTEQPEDHGQPSQTQLSSLEGEAKQQISDLQDAAQREVTPSHPVRVDGTEEIDICPICLCLLCEPTALTSCGHIFWCASAAHPFARLRGPKFLWNRISPIRL